MQKILFASIVLNVALIAFILHPKRKPIGSDVEAKVRLEQIQSLLKENDSLKSIDYRLLAKIDSLEKNQPKPEVIIFEKHEAIDKLSDDSVSVKYRLFIDSLRTEF